MLAVGSLPVVPAISGVEKDGIFAIRKEVPYIERMLAALDKARDLVIVGCGFIGVELAEECRRNRDLNITLVEMLPHCLEQNYDLEFSLQAEEIMKAEGLHVAGAERVVAFEGDTRVQGVRLADGRVLKADMVVLAIGAMPNSDLAQKASLATGVTGGIQVNRYMQSGDERIFACGDCTEKVSFFDGRPTRLKLASIATMEARIAGANLFSVRRANAGVIGVYSTILGDTAFAAAGLT